MTSGPPSPETPLRVSVDINIWIPFFEALQHSRQPSATVELVHMIRDMKAGNMDIQLVMSTEMFSTLEEKLTARGYSLPAVSEFISALEGLIRAGPLAEEPHFLATGRDQLAMHDREDAGVLASAFLSRADLLVTDNLKDFETNDSEGHDTREIHHRSGNPRQLRAIIHERADGVALIVAHPYDVLDWFRKGLRPTPESIRSRYGATSSYRR